MHRVRVASGSAYRSKRPARGELVDGPRKVGGILCDIEIAGQVYRHTKRIIEVGHAQ